MKDENRCGSEKCDAGRTSCKENIVQGRGYVERWCVKSKGQETD